MDASLMFSSKTDEGVTPQDFFNELDREFGFNFDVCALPEKRKDHPVLHAGAGWATRPWAGVVWCNPPYGRQIGKWVEKAALSAKWFHEYIYGKAEIRFVRAANPAPFPSMVVVFRGGEQDR